MNNPALKGEVSQDKNKMLKLTNPRLRRSNVMLDSFGSCVSDATKEFSRTPKMPFSKMVSKPWMFLEKLIRAVSFKQLQSFANRNGWGELNKQVDVVSPNIEFINLKSSSVGDSPQEKLTIHSQSVELKRIFSIFNFPDKMESILSEAVFSGFQIHFSSPEHSSNYVHQFISKELGSNPNSLNIQKELNFEVNGDSSPNLKIWVSSP